MNSRMLESLSDQFLEYILSGQVDAGLDVVELARQNGFDLKTIYSEVILAAEVKVGELWHENKISTAEEHLATQATITAIEKIRVDLKPARRIGRRAIVTCVEGEHHFLGGKSVADFLHFDGWNLEFLGADTPTEDLIGFIRGRDADLLCISITQKNLIEPNANLIGKLKSRYPDLPVMLGGKAAQKLQQQSEVKADGVGKNAQLGVKMARELTGLPPQGISVDQYLADIGSRLREIRRSKKKSQEVVGRDSGLDRAYISGVEHGKHNLSIGALVKLAEALEVTLEEIIVPPARKQGHGLKK